MTDRFELGDRVRFMAGNDVIEGKVAGHNPAQGLVIVRSTERFWRVGGGDLYKVPDEHS